MEEEVMQISKEEMETLSGQKIEAPKKEEPKEEETKEEKREVNLINLLSAIYQNILLLHEKIDSKKEDNSLEPTLKRISELLERRVIAAEQMLEVAKKDIQLRNLPKEEMPDKRDGIEEEALPQKPFE